MVPAAVISGLLSMVIKLMSLPVVVQPLVFAWNLEEELERLQRVLLRIQFMLGDAEARQITDEGVKAWLRALKDSAYDAEDILDRVSYEVMRRQARGNMASKVRDFVSPNNPLILSLKIGNNLKNIIDKIEAIAAESRQFNFAQSSQAQISASVRPVTHSYVDESEVLGREADREEIVNCLVTRKTDIGDKKVRVISIVGMGGIGKTTLAQLVYNDYRVEKHFLLRIWICVSTDFRVEELTKTVVESATGTKCDLPSSNMDMLQKRVREVLEGKMYLLVLDDVWNEDSEKWDMLKTLLGCGREGSNIIVTTRSLIVSQVMDAVPTHLSVLSEDDSWTLFRRRAFRSEAEEQQNLVAIGKDIVKKCKGVPLAVKTLGSTMRSKSDIQQWLSVKNAEVWDSQVGKDRILSPLMLSYSYLPSHLKQCFAFCAIFPKGYLMDKERLIQLWMANGFVSPEGGSDLEFEGHNMFNELVWRSFLQDVQEHRSSGYLSYTTCKLHDLMHDLAQSIMYDECFAMSEPSQPGKVLKRVRHFSSIYQRTQPHSIPEAITNLSSLRTFLLAQPMFASLRAPGRSRSTLHELQKSKHLRAVQLSDDVIPKVSSTISVQNWGSLKYLDLSGTCIKTLPESTCMLFNLQTLRLTGCRSLLRLPKGMRALCSLRHLYIDRCYRLEKMPASMGQLSHLQTLTNYIVGSSDEGRGIEELMNLNLGGQLDLSNLDNVRNGAEAREAHLDCKRNLHVLKLSWKRELYTYYFLPETNSEEVLEALKPPNDLKELKIMNYRGVQSPIWMKDPMLLQNLVHINMNCCRRLKHLPPFGHLPSLEILKLTGLDGVNYICSNSETHDRVLEYPSLRELELDSMKTLNGWWRDEGSQADPVFFPRLSSLTIEDCPHLKTMPKCFPSIQDFTIKSGIFTVELEQATELLISSREDHQIVTRESRRETELLQCLRQNGFFKNLKSLKTIHIRGDAAVLLFPTDEEESTLFLWASIEEVCIEECNGLFSLEQSSFWTGFTSIQELVIEYCALVYWPENELRGLNSLKKLRVSNCKNLIGPSESSSSSKAGPLNLESLKIVDCDKLVKVPKFPASVRVLSITRCSNLMSLMFKGQEEPVNLQTLEISFCDRLTLLSKLLQQQLPRLQELRIVACPLLQIQCKSGGLYWPLISDIPCLEVK